MSTQTNAEHLTGPALAVNFRGAAAALTTVVALLAMLLWPQDRPWTAVALTVAALWWLKEADDAAVRRRLGPVRTGAQDR